MKKLICMLMALCLLCCGLVACGGEEEKAPEKVTIVGTWDYGSMDCAYIFNADGTGAYRFGGADMPFTYTDDGKTVTIQYENSDAPNVFNYTIDGDKLSIEDSFGSIVEYTKKN